MAWHDITGCHGRRKECESHLPFNVSESQEIMDTIYSTVLGQELVLMEYSFLDWDLEWTFLVFLTQGPWMISLSCHRSYHRNLGLISTNGTGKRSLPPSCSSLHDRPCIVIMPTFFESFLSFYPQPLLLCNCSGSQDSWNWASWGAIFNFFTQHSWGLGPHTVASTHCFFLLEDADRKPMPMPGVEGAWEAGGPVVFSQPLGPPISASYSV